MKYSKIYLAIVLSFFMLWKFAYASAVYWFPVPGRGAVSPVPDAHMSFLMIVLLPLAFIQMVLMLPGAKLIEFLASLLGVKTDDYAALIPFLNFLLTAGWITLLIYCKDRFYKKIDDDVDAIVNAKGRVKSGR